MNNNEYNFENSHFDVFISCKSEDYKQAEILYDFLKHNGREVFLSSVVLRKMGDAEYYQRITEAIDKSDHMIVFATKAEYLISSYVKREWTLFANEISSGRKKGNLLSIISRNVMIDKMPITLRNLQLFYIDDYKDSLIGFLPKSKKTLLISTNHDCVINIFNIDRKFIQKLDVNKSQKDKISLEKGTYFFECIGKEDPYLYFEQIRHEIDTSIRGDDILDIYFNDYVLPDKIGKILIISAPIGSGKTTIIRSLINDNEEYGKYVFPVSCTTRPPRNEYDAGAYHFMSEREFRNKIAHNEFIEYEEVMHGIFYGTLRRPIIEHLMMGRVLVFEVDVKTAAKIKNFFGCLAKSIFIQPPSIDVLKSRLEKSGYRSSKQIDNYLIHAEDEMTYADKFDIRVVNDNLTTTIIEVKSIINSFLSE